MTRNTFNIRVPAFQRERIIGMTEIFAKAVHTIVAGETICAVVDGMCLCEGRIHLLMTGLAIERIETGDALRVAIRTDERLTRDPLRVTTQRISQLRVRKIRACGDRQWCIWAAVIGMTVPASQVGILVADTSMQRSDFGHLRTNFNMAGNAMIGHGIRFPWRSVTGLAIAIGRGVGGNASNGLTRLGVEGTRTVEYTATSERRLGNEEYGQ